MRSLSQRFRLAGVYCWSPSETNAEHEVRKAIIDNLQTKPVKESVVVEGDMLDTVLVAKVLEKSVVLREGAVEEELFLTYAAGSGTGAVASATITGGSDDGVQGKAVFTNRFGAYMGEGRWIMNRDGLLSYVQEMIDSPARAYKLFESMAPVYGRGRDGRRVVEAYRLKVTGEKDFYDAVGLNEGDIVRKVNGERVTSQTMAMRWIDSFRAGKESAFVMDIERSGTPMRLEYMIR